MWSAPPDHPLRRLFAGLTEHAFLTSIGITDPRLIDYVTELLTRFTHFGAVYRLTGSHGRPDKCSPDRERNCCCCRNGTRAEWAAPSRCA